MWTLPEARHLGVSPRRKMGGRGVRQRLCGSDIKQAPLEGFQGLLQEGLQSHSSPLYEMGSPSTSDSQTCLTESESSGKLFWHTDTGSYPEQFGFNMGGGAGREMTQLAIRSRDSKICRAAAAPAPRGKRVPGRLGREQLCAILLSTWPLLSQWGELRGAAVHPKLQSNHPPVCQGRGLDSNELAQEISQKPRCAENLYFRRLQVGRLSSWEWCHRKPSVFATSCPASVQKGKTLGFPLPPL